MEAYQDALVAYPDDPVMTFPDVLDAVHLDALAVVFRGVLVVACALVEASLDDLAEVSPGGLEGACRDVLAEGCLAAAAFHLDLAQVEMWGWKRYFDLVPLEVAFRNACVWALH